MSSNVCKRSQIKTRHLVNMKKQEYQVMVVGAGPVGLLTALGLAQRGIRTLVIERHKELLPTTRAVNYHPVVLERLRTFRILEKVEKIAFLNNEGTSWRTIEGEELARLPMVGDEHALLLGQQRLNKLLLEELEQYPSIEVRFNTGFGGCEQHEGSRKVKVMVHESSATREEDDLYEVDWLVAADGANSSVRRSLGVAFEGFSYLDVNMVGVDVYYDFAKHVYGTHTNFIVDPDDTGIVIYCGQTKDMQPNGESPPLWRVAYLESATLSTNQKDVLERAQIRCSHFAHGKQDIEIARAEPYRLHQRCAAVAHQGRVVFVGDALHSNNPIGGLGLTTGICDAAAMSTALGRVCVGDATESLVFEAANNRRKTFLETTNIQSQKQLERLRGTDEASKAERRAFFEALNSDPQMPAKARAEFEKIAGSSFAAVD